MSADRSGSILHLYRLSFCSDVSAERSGSAVRDSQPMRLSVCSDVSADRSGSAVSRSDEVDVQRGCRSYLGRSFTLRCSDLEGFAAEVERSRSSCT